MLEVSSRTTPVFMTSMTGAIGRLRWVNADPAGVFRAQLEAPFWGRCWWGDDWWKVWSWER